MNSIQTKKGWKEYFAFGKKFSEDFPTHFETLAAEERFQDKKGDGHPSGGNYLSEKKTMPISRGLGIEKMIPLKSRPGRGNKR
jgi:hypothetical protein